MRPGILAFFLSVLAGAAAPAQVADSPNAWEGGVSQWSLEDKLGQILMVGFRSLDQVRELRPGGVVLFSWAMKDVEQTRALTESLQVLSQQGLKSPLFIATDHEGGKVLRLRRGLTNFPDAAAVGAEHDPELAFRVGKQMGHELAALGINMNLAPVLDLGGARSFLENRAWSEEPQSVGELATSFIRGLHAARVMAVAKHFPGHGASGQDSHFELPSLSKGAEALWQEDLLPFRDAVHEGVPAIMTAHVEVPSVVRGPASLAPAFIEELLRHKMGFKGLVLTDDLEMGGVHRQLGAPVEDLALRALQAGTDMILVVWSESVQKKILQRLRRALAEGEITMAWLDEKVRHIQTIKAQALAPSGGIYRNPFWRENLRLPASLALAEKISAGAVQWLKGQEGSFRQQLIERKNERWNLVVPSEGLRQHWLAQRPGDRVWVSTRRPSLAEVDDLRRHLHQALQENAPLLVVTSPRASGSEEVFQAVESELRSFSGRAPVLWVHQGARPYEMAQRKAWSTASPLLAVVGLHSSSTRSFEAFLTEIPAGAAQVRQ